MVGPMPGVLGWLLGFAAPSARDGCGAVDVRRHMPELDGLRGLALLMVLVTHWVTFGNTGSWIVDGPMAVIRTFWTGVDLFFVLSGFLITGILVDTLHDPRYLGNFYARRALRILPLYYAVLAFVFVLFPFMLPAGTELWRGDPKPWWYLVFLSNLAEGMGIAQHATMVVTWSLAVEEHFYLIWPLMVWRFRHHVGRLALGTIVFSFLLRVVFMHGLDANGQLVGFLTPFRLDGLALGSLIAVLMRRGAATRARLYIAARRALIPLMLAIAGLIVVHEAQVRHRIFVDHGQAPIVVSVGYLVAALFFGSVMVQALVTSGGGWLSAMLRWRPLMELGRISFAAYLLHQPVRFFCLQWLYGPMGLTDRPSAGWLVMLPLQFIMLVVICQASWHWFERPILDSKRHFHPPPAPRVPA